MLRVLYSASNARNYKLEHVWQGFSVQKPDSSKYVPGSFLPINTKFIPKNEQTPTNLTSKLARVRYCCNTVS
jgi:hypothetical protein